MWAPTSRFASEHQSLLPPTLYHHDPCSTARQSTEHRTTHGKLPSRRDTLSVDVATTPCHTVLYKALFISILFLIELTHRVLKGVFHVIRNGCQRIQCILEQLYRRLIFHVYKRTETERWREFQRAAAAAERERERERERSGERERKKKKEVESERTQIANDLLIAHPHITPQTTAYDVPTA
jgi:hypothetical protein